MHSGRVPPRRLSAADSLMWRIESDPVLRSPVLVVGLLDRSQPLRGCLVAALTEVVALGRHTKPSPRPAWAGSGLC